MTDKHLKQIKIEAYRAYLACYLGDYELLMQEKLKHKNSPPITHVFGISFSENILLKARNNKKKVKKIHMNIGIHDRNEVFPSGDPDYKKRKINNLSYP